MTTLYSTLNIPATGGTSLSSVSVPVTLPLVCVHAKLTNGAAIPNLKRGVQLILAASPFTVAAASAPALLPPSVILDLQPSQEINGTAYFKSEPIILEGTTLYAWLNADALGADLTLDAQLVEIA